MSVGLKRRVPDLGAARRQQEDAHQHGEHHHGARGGQQSTPRRLLSPRHPSTPSRSGSPCASTYGLMVGTLVKSLQVLRRQPCQRAVGLQRWPAPCSHIVTSLFPLAETAGVAESPWIGTGPPRPSAGILVVMNSAVGRVGDQRRDLLGLQCLLDVVEGLEHRHLCWPWIWLLMNCRLVVPTWSPKTRRSSGRPGCAWSRSGCSSAPLSACWHVVVAVRERDRLEPAAAPGGDLVDVEVELLRPRRV